MPTYEALKRYSIEELEVLLCYILSTVRDEFTAICAFQYLYEIMIILVCKDIQKDYSTSDPKYNHYSMWKASNPMAELKYDWFSVLARTRNVLAHNLAHARNCYKDLSEILENDYMHILSEEYLGSAKYVHNLVKYLWRVLHKEYSSIVFDLSTIVYGGKSYSVDDVYNSVAPELRRSYKSKYSCARMYIKQYVELHKR